MLCLVIGGSGLGYVWQKDQIARLGRQISTREARLAALEGQNDILRRQLASMRSVFYVEYQIKQLKLGLVQRPATEVWHLTEPAEQGPVPERQYAAQSPPRTP